MSLILNIDTALDTATVCLAKDGNVLQLEIIEDKKDPSAGLHHLVVEILQKQDFKTGQLDAVAVSIGPGSYTGLRVGLSAAKGLCYALRVPLITVNTLELMAFAVKKEASDLICPMIDARRMEVFVAVFDGSMQEKVAAHALIIDGSSFAPLLSAHKILFCGNGSPKLKALITNDNATFTNTRSNASHLAALSRNCFLKKEFADLVYTEPLYLKEFYSPNRKD